MREGKGDGMGHRMVERILEMSIREMEVLVFALDLSLVTCRKADLMLVKLICWQISWACGTQTRDFREVIILKIKNKCIYSVWKFKIKQLLLHLKRSHSQ